MKVDSYRSKPKSLRSNLVTVLVKSGETVALPPEVTAELGELELWKTLDLDPAEPRVALDVKAAISDIEKQGFHVSRAEIRTTITDIPNVPPKK